MTFTYENSLNLLTSQSRFCINLGLERIKSVLELLGNPQDLPKIIHVAGTNGKGSVCAMTANILQAAGYKTGLYTSPHLVDYTERIKINSVEITKKNFALYVKTVCDIADDNKIFLTEFEILTAVMYKYFADNKVEVAVVETGLGGRYDATNAADNTILSVITSVSEDHTDRLGNDTDKIAFEKAGIIKKNSNVIVSSENAGVETIKRVAAQKNSKVIFPRNTVGTLFENNRNYLISGCKKYEFSLAGEYQKYNAELVFEIIKFLNDNGYKIDEKAVETGLKTVKWGARLEYIKDKNILIDGAHNPEGASALKKFLDLRFKNEKKIFVYSTLDTKDYKAIAKILFDKNDEIYYYEFKHKNMLPFEKYTEEVPKLKNINKVSPEQINSVLQKEGLKVVTGSLYMIGSLYSELKRS